MAIPEFTLTAGAGFTDLVSPGDDGPLETSALEGMRVKFTSNITEGEVLALEGGLRRHRAFIVTLDAAGKLNGDDGVTMLANDPELGLEHPLEWTISFPDGVTIDGFNKPVNKWTFTAPDAGETVSLDEIPHVVGQKALGSTRGLRGFRTYAVPVDPEDPETLYQWVDVNGDNVGEPTAPPVNRRGMGLRSAASVAYLGDSLTAINSNIPADSYSESYPSLAAFLTGGRFVFAGNYGVASDTVQMIAARVSTVIAANPAYCMILAGSNSTTKGIAHFNDARAVYETGIIQPLLAASIQPVLCTIPPRDFTRQWATNAGLLQGPGVYLLTLAWNVFVRAMAAKYRLPLCDMYAAVTDPNTGNYIDGYVSDTIHWTGPGVYAAAQAAADALVNPVVPSVSLEHDRYSLINLCSSPVFLSGLGSGLGGLYPSGWNGPSSGVATSVVDPVEGDGLEAGKWLRLEKTGTSSATVNMIRTVAAMATNGVTVNTGDRVAFGFRYQIDIPVFDPNTYVTFSLVFRDGSAATLSSATPLNQMKQSHAGVVWWEATVPSGTVDVRFNAQFSAHGDASLQLGQMTIYDLTAIGSPSFREVDQAIPTAALSIPADPANPVPQQPSIAAGTTTESTVPYTITPSGVGAAASTYQVEYCLPEDLGTWTSGGGSSSTGTITGLDNDQLYWIRARGVNAGGHGPWSVYVQTTTALSDDPPAQVTGLTAGTATTTTQPLSWDAMPVTTGYIVQYKENADSTWIAFSTPTGTAETVTGLDPGTSYDYRVAATNAAGTGTYSATTTASTQAAASVLASDSFNRADTSAGTLGTLDNAAGGSFSGSWTATGQMQILSNRVSAASISTPRWATVDLSDTDGYCEVEIVTGDGGVVGRYTDTTSYYQFRYNNTSGWGTMNAVTLEKRSGGSTTTLWTSSAGVFTPGSGQKLGIDCQGNQITPYINGVAQTPVTDSTITTGTRWGMRSASPGTAFTLDNWLAQDFV